MTLEAIKEVIEHLPKEEQSVLLRWLDYRHGRMPHRRDLDDPRSTRTRRLDPDVL